MAFDVYAEPGYGPETATPLLDKGPAARAVQRGAGMRPAPQPDTDVELQVPPPEKPGILRQAFPAATERTHAENPLEHDPLAAAIVQGLPAAGLGTLVGAGAEALGAAPAIARVASSAAGGAAVDPEHPFTGAALGAAAPLVATWARGAAERIAGRKFQALGKVAGKTGRTELAELAPEDVVDVMSRNEIAVPGRQAIQSQAATNAAIEGTGQKMRAARDALGTAPGAQASLGDAMESVRATIDGLRKGPQADRPLADAIHKWAKDFWDANGGQKGAPLSIADLSDAVTQLQGKGYGGFGSKLSEASAAKAARIAAGALDEIIDARVATAAASSPAMEQAAGELRGLTRDYRILKTLQPIVDERAVAEKFAPSRAGELLRYPVEHPIKTLTALPLLPLRAAGAGLGAAGQAADWVAARGAPAAEAKLGDLMEAVRAKILPAGGAADWLARLYVARQAGQLTPALVEQAAASGVAPAALAQFRRPPQPAEAQ